MPAQQGPTREAAARLPMSDEDILRRYLDTPGRFSPAEDSLATQRGYGYMSGITPSSSATTTRRTTTRASEPAPQEESGTLSNIWSSISGMFGGSDAKPYQKLDEQGKPVAGTGEGTGPSKVTVDTNRTDPPGSAVPAIQKLNNNMSGGLGPKDQIDAAGMAFTGATAADAAEGKKTIADIQAGKDDVTKKDPNDMSMGEKLAMIALAIAPTIAGYAMYGEKGAYIGGIATFEGAKKWAEMTEKEQEAQKNRDSKEKTSGGKNGAGGDLMAAKVAYNEKEDHWDYWRPSKTGEGGKFDGVLAPAPLVKNPATGEMEEAKKPARKTASAATSAPVVYPASSPPAPPTKPIYTQAPAEVQTKLPATTKSQTMREYSDQFKAITGREEPFFAPYLDMTYDEFVSSVSKESTGKITLETFKDIRKVIEARDSDAAKASRRGATQKELAAINNSAREKLEKLRQSGRLTVGSALENLRAKNRERLANLRAQNAKIAKTSDPKILRDQFIKDAVPYGKDTDSFLTKAGNIASLNSNSDPTQVSAVFFAFMKLVQQDDSVVRESDMEVVNKFTPLLTQGQGAFEKYFKDNPGIAPKVVDMMRATSQKLANNRVMRQLAKHDSFIRGAELSGITPNQVVNPGTARLSEDWARNHFPTYTVQQAGKVADGEMFWMSSGGKRSLMIKGKNDKGVASALPVRTLQ